MLAHCRSPRVGPAAGVSSRRIQYLYAASALPSGRSAEEPHLQLATAKLPTSVAVAPFCTYLYNWAATLTQSGANYPFILPLQTDKLAAGFKVSLLRAITKGEFASAGDVQATVEAVPNEGNVLFVRFFEGPASLTGRAPGSVPAAPDARLESILSGLVDVPQIMQTMPLAIRKAVQVASTAP